jgi:hypothetical protein
MVRVGREISVWLLVFSSICKRSAFPAGSLRRSGWVECLDVNVLVFGRPVPAIPVDGLPVP